MSKIEKLESQAAKPVSKPSLIVRGKNFLARYELRNSGEGKKVAFTLAEVLITLAIIGVVAALTIPTLISKMSERAANARKDTIEARLLDGINRYSTLEDGLSKPYETTYDFLVGLSKHYKMAQICKADEITNCIPYSEINYDDNGTPSSIEVKKLQKIDSFMATGKENYLAPASFITAQGTPVIMALKKDCAWDTGKAMRSIQDSGCIAYMYDESGARLPNKFGKDIIPHGLTITGKGVGTPIATVGGYKIMNKLFVTTTGITSEQCVVEKNLNYGIESCPISSGDTWAEVMKYCHDNGWRLPNTSEGIAIAKGLFKDSNGNHPNDKSWNRNIYKIDLELVNALGLKNTNSNDSDVSISDVDITFSNSVISVRSVEYAYSTSVTRSDVNSALGERRSGYKRSALCISD